MLGAIQHIKMFGIQHIKNACNKINESKGKNRKNVKKPGRYKNHGASLKNSSKQRICLVKTVSGQQDSISSTRFPSLIISFLLSLQIPSQSNQILCL